jgi:hypothetical protein
LLERCAEGVVQRLLGEVEVTKQPDQRGEYAARFGTIDRIDRAARTVGRIRARRRLLRGGFHRPSSFRCQRRPGSRLPPHGHDLAAQASPLILPRGATLRLGRHYPFGKLDDQDRFFVLSGKKQTPLRASE